jgi:hypothetical protein
VARDLKELRLIQFDVRQDLHGALAGPLQPAAQMLRERRQGLVDDDPILDAVENRAGSHDVAVVATEVHARPEWALSSRLAEPLVPKVVAAARCRDGQRVELEPQVRHRFEAGLAVLRVNVRHQIV